MCWLKVVNGRTLSLVALDASVPPCLCPGVVKDTCCLCKGLDTPVHLLGNDDPSCPLAVHTPVFRQMLASLWFCNSVPLLSSSCISVVPLEVRTAVGYCSGFVAAVKPVHDAVPWMLVQLLSAHECFQVWCDKVEKHQSMITRHTNRQL